MPATTEQIAMIGEPTPREEVKKRPVFNKQKEQVGELDYVDARFCMDRLDSTVGPDNWADEFRVTDGGVIGRVGIHTESGWVWKEDVGTESTIEETKGSFSDAFKRACVKWGIARDLYDARAGQGGRSPKPAQGQSSTQVRAQTGAPKFMEVRNPDTAPWKCPEHDGVVVWPAGVSASGRKYDAFYACPKGRDCSHKAPFGTKVKPEHLNVSSGTKPDDALPF